MRMITLAVLFTAAFASIAQAQNNNPLGDKTFTCDFSPTDAMRPGLIYAINRTLVFPAGVKEKFEFVEPQFERAYDIPTASHFGGARTTETVTMAAAADYLGTDKSKLGASANKKIELVRSIPNHRGMILYQTQLTPAYDWFKAFKKTSGYNKNRKYFLVREVRFTDKMVVSIKKETAAQLSAGGDISKVGSASLSAKRESVSTYDLEGQFAVPSVFCMKVESLK